MMDSVQTNARIYLSSTIINEIRGEIDYVENYLGKLKEKLDELEKVINSFRDGNE